MERPAQQPSDPRKSIGVHMKCCHVYVYAHLNAAGNAYVAWCPKCAKQVRLEVVAEGGSSSRFFEAS
ncbi:MAG: hypothetical protein R3C12_17870 [Planctomycetaceae bacterium]|nr:hypothetical protein [Planctomycetaceae bacterium]